MVRARSRVRASPSAFLLPRHCSSIPFCPLNLSRANHGCANAIGGQDFRPAVDAQASDEDAEQRLGLLGLAVGDDTLKLVGDGAERCRFRRCGRVCSEF